MVKVKITILTTILGLHQKYRQDPLIRDVLTDLESRFSDHIISVFGIGSYFDENLPANWIKNDVDLVVIVDSLEVIPNKIGRKCDTKKNRLGIKKFGWGLTLLKDFKIEN